MESIPGSVLCSGIYSVGNCLKVPFRREAELATRLCMQYEPHDVAWHAGRSRVLEVIELVIALLPALVIGIVGELLCLSVAWLRPEYVIKCVDTQSDAKDALKVLCYNVAGLSPYVQNGLAHPMQRAEAIVGALREQDADVICLQEVFDLGVTEVFARGLHGYHVVHSVGAQEFVYGSGLLVASKYPIKEVAFTPFERGAYADAYAKKGALQVDVEVGTKSVRFINTHLQAVEECSEIRLQQMRTVAQMDSEAIVVGDLNPMLDAEFQAIDTIFKGRLSNPTSGTWYEKEGSGWGTSGWTRAKGSRVLDYIIARQGGVTGVLDFGTYPLSDHLPIVRDIVI